MEDVTKGDDLLGGEKNDVVVIYNCDRGPTEKLRVLCMSSDQGDYN